MPVDTVIDLVVKRSGRYDLDVAGYEAVLQYINEAQKMLDQLALEGKTTARVYKELAVGDQGVVLKYCRSVESVWAYDTNGRRQLKKYSLNDLKAYYTEETVDPGDVAYYGIELVRPIGSSTDTPETITDLTVYSQQWALDNTIKDATWQGYTALILYPPAAAACTLEVVGEFDSIPLDLTYNTKSYWTEERTALLVRATMYQMEVDMRNSEGAKDWAGAIDEEMIRVNKDIVMQELADRDSEMEG